MSDHDDIRAVLVRYCQLCDDGRFDEWGELFAPDATFTVMGTTHEGRAAIQGFIEGAQPPEARGKHLLSEPHVEVDGDRARVRTDYAFVARADAALAITSTGRYHDTLARDPDGTWHFTSREIVFLGD